MTFTTARFAFERCPYWLRVRLVRGLVDIQLDRDGALHLWVGPAGLHLFWPALWTSRVAWCDRWREPLE